MNTGEITLPSCLAINILHILIQLTIFNFSYCLFISIISSSETHLLFNVKIHVRSVNFEHLCQDRAFLHHNDEE